GLCRPALRQRLRAARARRGQGERRQGGIQAGVQGWPAWRDNEDGAGRGRRGQGENQGGDAGGQGERGENRSRRRGRRNKGRNQGRNAGMKDNKNLIVGLDIGTSKVVAVVAELAPDGRIEIT